MMKKNILFTFMAMAAAITMLACEQEPVADPDSGHDGTEQSGTDDPGTTPEPEQGTLLVGTFNIRYYNTSDGVNAWESRRDAVMKFINSSAADILVLQEVCQVQAKYITENLDDRYGYIEYDRNTGNSILDDEDSEGVFLLWDKDRLSVEDKGYFWLADPSDRFPEYNKDDNTYSSWHSALPRLALWIKAEDNESPGQKICFIGTHYDHISTQAKTGSSNLVVRKLREMTGENDLKNAGTAVFAAGDLNTESGATELAALRNAMYDARKESPKTSTSDTFNNFGVSGGQSVIDHIFFGGNLEPEQYDVITNPYGAPGQYISDHYPVLFRCAYKQ